ncbi:hypothetical protein GGE24_007251 [Bradyrhizobium centrosematis]|nr:hypothetical protein [Bradyrhizobium centrosematis]MCS3777876.1 hypothetical protein [Bradyrhizobium centrosematis]
MNDGIFVGNAHKALRWPKGCTAGKFVKDSRPDQIEKLAKKLGRVTGRKDARGIAQYRVRPVHAKSSVRTRSGSS